MLLSNLIARHSARPRGMLGRLVFGRYLDRSNRRINQLVFDALACEPCSRVLEVGFGGGALLLRIARHLDGGRVDGVEISAAMLARAARRARRLGLESRVRLQACSVENLPFDDARFDRICSVHTIYFWPDLGAGLAELARVCRPGGTLVLGFSSRRALIDAGRAGQGFRAYSRDELAAACAAAGFEVERIDAAERQGGGAYYALRAVRTQ